MNKTEKCYGYIQLMFFDSNENEIVNIGGAGFITPEDVDAEWENIPAFSGDSSFIADLMDSNGDIIDDKQVSAETCESLMGLPIAQLIAEGRAKLAAELDRQSTRTAAGTKD
ncbi:hypothetical protein BRM42_08505 [Xanthomonas oryzae pv. oryzae]|uniref:hypothetical protein n=1 Tax=Xanthomonas citri TaxID=346 RepID=UPI00052B6210|nr:hypothetical protein [Xanthomonas citri]RBG58092.1 hypothetical protein BRM42_08505 [Xanthomonas oryzae pv. oryzae]CEH40205.1 conserved hypothetical protein [Xanthomonas citri pv. citri]